LSRLGADVGQVAPFVLAALEQLIIGDERVRADRPSPDKRNLLLFLTCGSLGTGEVLSTT